MDSLTLEIVEEDFKQWRSARKSKSESIPLSLWARAVALYPKYKRSSICKKLCLSGSQLKLHLERAGHVFTQRGGFALATHHQEVASKAKPIHVENKPVDIYLQGKNRELKLSVDVRALSEVLPHLDSLL